jgi:hypothetical protein
MMLTSASSPPPAPRRFPWRTLDAAPGFLMLFGGIWCLVGSMMVVLFSLTGGPFWNDLILDRRAVPTQATPTSVDRTGIRVNNRRGIRVRYGFTDAAGARHAGGCAARTPRSSGCGS